MTLLIAALWGVFAVAFALMYHFLPDRRVHWRRALAGGVGVERVRGRVRVGGDLGALAGFIQLGRLHQQPVALGVRRERVKVPRESPVERNRLHDLADPSPDQVRRR